MVRLCIAIVISATLHIAHASQPQSIAASNPISNPVSGIIKSLQAQDFDQALRQCDEALHQTPSDPRIFTLRGMAYAGKGSTPSALDAYRQALRIDPAYLPALEGAAQIEYRQRSPEAKPLLLKVLAQRPTDPTSHTMLGFLEYEAKDCTAAITHFERGGDVLAKQPAAQAAYAACLTKAGRYEQAIPLFQQALTAEPSLPGLRFNLAIAQWKANRPLDALSTIEPALASGDEDTLLLAANLYESVNQTQQAVDLFRTAILADPKDIDAYLDFASLSYDHASMQVGVDVLNAGLTQLPNEARLYLVRGVLYAQLGKIDEATQDFATANRLDPNISVLGAAQGLAASQQHQAGHALATFRAAARSHPNDALTQFLLSEALSQESPQEGTPDYTEEVNAAKAASRLDPSMVAAHDLLATIYLQDGHTNLAIEQSQAALTVDPKDQQALYHLILALRKTGQKDEIASLLKQLTTLRNTNQAELSQSKRYQLQEMPVAATAH